MGSEKWLEHTQNIQKYREALQLHNERLQNPTGYVPCYYTDHGFLGDLHGVWGRTLRAIGDFYQAEMHLRKALECFAAAVYDDWDCLPETHLCLSKLLSRKGKRSESAEQMILACQLYHEKQLRAREGAKPMGLIEVSKWNIDGKFAEDEL